MYHDGTMTPPSVRLGALARMIESFEREQIELAVDMLIARLDAADGDPDLEDDDPAGGNVEDQGEPGTWAEREDGCSGGHAYGDDDREPEDVTLRARHRHRIQMERCYPQFRYGRVEYRLFDGDSIPAGAQPWA